MIRNMIKLSCVTAIILSLFTANTFANMTYTDERVDKKTVKRTYTYISKSESDQQSVDEEIRIDGKRYKLQNVEYKTARARISVTKTIELENKDELEKSITKDGKKLILDMHSIEWEEEHPEMVLTKTKEYATKEEIPSSITSGDYYYDRIGIKPSTKKIPFSATAVFTAPKENVDMYMFNGKVVTIKDGKPTWKGYESDVKEYLGINGSEYTISGAKWNGKSYKKGDSYVREATFSGTRKTPIYVATFQYVGVNEEETIYTAKVKYVEETVPINAIATYERRLNTFEKVAIGAGIAVIALGLVLILFALKRRKDKEEEEDYLK